jgi:hypothetical protein
MTNQIVNRQVTAICGESRAEGALRVCEFGRSERIKRAWKTGGVCAVLVVVCACIPGAHFVLVPLMVLLTPWLVHRTWKIESAIDSIDIQCAQCHGELTRVSSRERYPLFENCMSCRRENRIILKS